MNYIFIINNIELGERIWNADEIMKSLLEKRKWAFSSSAPNLKHLDHDDRVVIYLAGKGNRYFSADFTIDGKPYEAESEPNEQGWLAMFPIRIAIRKIHLWAERLPIGAVIAQLDFIKDKKNYGLYFRQSTRVIEEKDFSIIFGNSNQNSF